MARTLLLSVWEETRDVLKAVDYHTMELFTRLVSQMYRTIHDAGEKADPLREMCTQFGGFYTFAEDWLEDNTSASPVEIEKMRCVLHDGLTKWLLMVLEKPEERELVRQLCDAARGLVFPGDAITFDRGTLVAREFVLAGYLMHRPETRDVKAQVIERLFHKGHPDIAEVDLNTLVAFYLGNQFPVNALEPYLRIFYRPTRTTTDWLTGSSHSFGHGMIGQHEMTLAFIYLAASALGAGMDDPEVIPEDMSFSLNEEAMRVVGDLFGDIGINHGIEQLKNWVASCKKSHEDLEAKKIADAALNKEKVEKFQEEFWESYRQLSPILSMCLRNENYVLNKTACSELRDRVFKINVIDWEYPVVGDGGNDHAMGLARYMEGNLLDKLTKRVRTAPRIAGGLSAMMTGAASWLSSRRCTSENALLVSRTKHGPASQLYRDKDFVWSSKEEAGSIGFDGFYRGFPVVWLRDEKPQKEGSKEEGEPVREQVIAIDLHEWKGIAVRDTVITQREFGELTIRLWTEQEIEEAIASGKLKKEDVDKAKRTCPIDICLHWELVDAKPPSARAFEAVVDEPKGGAN